MFPSNAAAAAKRLGKRRVREVGGETAEPLGHFFNPHGHQHQHRSSTSIPVDGRRSYVHKILNNPAAAPFSYMALLTAVEDDDDDDDHDDYECCPISHRSDQINQMITFHNENLRQSMLGMVENQHRAAEERAAKRLRASEEQKEELERLVELYKGEAERLLTRVRHLEDAASEGRRYAEAEEEEAESSFEDPDRVGPVRLDCKVCERELATVMVWPCRHVCVCARCDAATKCCPVCRQVKTTSVQVCLPLD